MLHTAAVIALLTTFFSLIVKFVGLPDQIRTNHRRKSTDGVSTLYFVLGFVSYLLWGIHGYLIHDVVLMVSQGVAGVITSGIILWQIWKYRKSPSIQERGLRPRWLARLLEAN